MKKFLQFASLIACALGLAAFVLLMITPAIKTTVTLLGTTTTTTYAGLAALFAGGKVISKSGDTTLSTAFDGKAAPIALVAWILLLVAILAMVVSFLLPLLKVKADAKVLSLVALCGAILLLVAGILLFFTLPSFAKANEWSNTDNSKLTFGWVLSAILALVGAVIGILPSVLALVKKK